MAALPNKTAMNRKGFSLLALWGSVPVLLVAALLILAVAAPAPFATAQQPAPADTATIPADQLDSLVAPIALYPDPLLAQVLAASTYPIEIVQLQQWLTKNPGLKDEALAKAVEQQPWDASVQALAGMPDVVKRLSDDIQWTTNLGNAFLAQQSDVMAAVQRMRSKAKGNGNLESTPQQIVETKTVENQQVIVIQQANPQVVYVPSYNPTVVYGPPVYPYPPVYYPPPPPPGSLAISFGVGMAMGAMMSGGWGYGCGWGHSNTVVINSNNTYVRNQNVRTGNVNNNWQHNGAHRGGTPYPNASTANRYGGTTRGASTANRQANAQQQIARQGGSGGDRSGAASGGGGRQSAGVSDRSAPGGAGNAREGNRPAPGGGGAGRSGGAGDRTSAGGGQDRIGSRDLSSSSGLDQRSGFGGGSDGFSGSRAQETSSRGASSRGGRSGGGGRRK